MSIPAGPKPYPVSVPARSRPRTGRPPSSVPGIAAVVVATTHNMLAPITAAVAAAGEHALVEKPCARIADALDCVIAAARRTGARVRAGYNHRYHPALQKAREIFDSGALGPLMFICARYSHGGRPGYDQGPGYDQEWRAVREISGGGEAIDQGVHLIDLACTPARTPGTCRSRTTVSCYCGPPQTR